MTEHEEADDAPHLTSRSTSAAGISAVQLQALCRFVSKTIILATVHCKCGCFRRQFTSLLLLASVFGCLP